MKKYLTIFCAFILSLNTYATAFAGIGDAYLFGGEDSNEDIHTEQEMIYVANWMEEIGFDTLVKLNQPISKFKNSRLNSDFLYVAGHGDRYSIGTGEGSGITVNGKLGYCDINSYDFDNAQCVILAACSTGDTTSRTSLGRTIYKNGANFVLGWTEDIETVTLGDFTEDYAWNLYRGRTYMNSYIRTQNYLINNVGVWDTSTIFKPYMLGNVNDTLEYSEASARTLRLSEDDTVDLEDDTVSFEDDTVSLNEATVNLNENAIKNSITVGSNKNSVQVEDFIDDRLQQFIVKDEVSVVDSEYKELETYIQENVDSNFTLDDYKVYDNEELNGVALISFKYEIGNIPTNYGLSVICIDGNAELITLTSNHENVNIKNMGKEISDNKSQANISIQSLKEESDTALFSMAAEKDGYSKYTIKDQTIFTYYDVETNEIVNVVSTVYEDENGLRFCTENEFN